MFQKGLSLFEIIVAAVLLSLAVAGLVGVFSSSRIHVQYSKTRVLAATLASFLLNNLSMEVRQAETSPGVADGWNQANNTLTVATGSVPGQTVTLSNIPFNSSYTISGVNDAAGNDTDLKRVQLAVNWTLTF